MQQRWPDERGQAHASSPPQPPQPLQCEQTKASQRFRNCGQLSAAERVAESNAGTCRPIVAGFALANPAKANAKHDTTFERAAKLSSKSCALA